jgi:hypothetical protein
MIKFDASSISVLAFPRDSMSFTVIGGTLLKILATQAIRCVGKSRICPVKNTGLSNRLVFLKLKELFSIVAWLLIVVVDYSTSALASSLSVIWFIGTNCRLIEINELM